MNIAIVLAQVLGSCFAVLGLSLLLNRKWTVMVVDDICKNQGVLWLAGLVTLLMGLVVLALNNDWSSGLSAVVTVIGWLMTIKGVAILLFPNVLVSYYRKMNKMSVFTLGGTGLFIFGLLLMWLR